ncbi:MAG: TlpA family protein disulfide reductase [Burkholderiaceae bacterium]|nr:TlpA family protein disulfide reductase [Burkholderiaceae bacterium]
MPPVISPVRSRRFLVLAAVIAAAVALAWFGAGYFKQGQVDAPKLSFTSLKGEQVSLEKLRGKVVLVNFWATSCPICMHEMPQMVDTYTQFKDQGLEFIAVAMSYDRPDYVLNYAQTRHLPFTVALDLQNAAAEAFGGIRATPTTFLIGKDGRIVRRYVGEPDFGALHRLLQQELSHS